MEVSDITAALNVHYRGAQLRKVEKLTGGVSAAVFRLDFLTLEGADASIVLRVMGKSGLESAVEYSLLSALFDAGLPTPQPLHFDSSGTHIKRPYVLMTYVAGSAAVPKDRVRHHLVAMADALAAIHKTPTASIPQLPLRIDPMDGLLNFLPSDDEWRDVREYCNSVGASAYHGLPVLLHGDFWPQNLIWSGERIVGIVDWEDAAFGDPLSDLACALLELRYLYDRATVDRFEAAYRRHLPIERGRLALWQLYVAAAAQHYMAHWGLPDSQETHMRLTALQQIREAATLLIGRNA